MAKVERTDGDMSSNLRQAAIMDAFVHESSVAPGTLARGIRITRVTIEYEIESTQALGSGRKPRTPMDTVREVAETARRTGGCGGIIAPPDDTPPDQSLSGPRDDHWAV